MYQSPVYLSSASLHSPSYDLPHSEFDPSRSSYNRLSHFENRNSSSSTFSTTPAFYDLSAHKQIDDTVSTSPYWIGTVPTSSNYRSSSPIRRAYSPVRRSHSPIRRAYSPVRRSYSPIKKRDISTESNVASLVLSGLVGTVSICLQAKANSIARASYRLGLASKDAAVSGAQAVGSGVVVSGGNVGSAIGGGFMAAGNAVSVVASGVARAGTGAVVGSVSTVGSAASGLAQAGSNTVVNSMNTINAASRRFPSLRFGLPNLNPFRSSPASAPAVDSDADHNEPSFPDRDVRRLQDGTLELFRNLEDGTEQRIAIIDESLFPTINGLSHDDLVQLASEIADAMFDIGSDTETDHFEEADGERMERTGMTVMDPIPMYGNEDNPWVAEIDEELLEELVL